MTETIKLTQYSHGAGCGCKIAPKVLDEILKSNLVIPVNDKLIVGNQSKDDAAVYALDSEKAMILTTDFFTPIVDDPFDFGRIAAANAISDVYAMGGVPLVAIAILGWPVEKLPVELATKVVEGGRAACLEAGIPLAGGHSIDSLEPIFGLAVTGLIENKHLKKNNTAGTGDLLFLTKRLGTGILSTAQKRGLLPDGAASVMIRQMATLNKIGAELGKIEGVTAMTDVTGFGLFGHLLEMVEGAGLSAEIYYDRILATEGVRELIGQRVFPDATTRNWSSYSEKIKFEKGVNVMEAFTLLPDPQTNGGILVSVKENVADEVIQLFKMNGLDEFISPIGKMTEQKEKAIYVLPQ